MKDIKILQDVFRMENDRYSKGESDYSATEIIDPPRLVALKKRYKDQIEPDISTGVDGLMGTAVHALFEKYLKMHNEKINVDYELETRLIEKFEIDGKTRKLSGQFDILENKQDLTDIKTAKVWKLLFDPEFTDWTKQQNIYAYLATKAGYPIRSVSALIVFKDWSEINMIRDPQYPKEPVLLQPLDLWSEEQQLGFIEYRLRLHMATDGVPDNELPACTTDETWGRFQDGTEIQFALFKKKAKRASKVFHGITDLATAVAESLQIKGVSSNSFIEIRHPIRKRCERYCPVSNWCNQYQTYCAKKKGDALNEIYSLEGVI